MFHISKPDRRETPTAPISPVPTDISHIRFIKPTFESNTGVVPPLIKVDNSQFITPTVNQELPTTMVTASPTAYVASDLPAPEMEDQIFVPTGDMQTVNQAGIMDAGIGPMALVGIGVALYLLFDGKI